MRLSLYYFDKTILYTLRISVYGYMVWLRFPFRYFDLVLVSAITQETLWIIPQLVLFWRYETVLVLHSMTSILVHYMSPDFTTLLSTDWGIDIHIQANAFVYFGPQHCKKYKSRGGRHFVCNGETVPVSRRSN